MPASPRDFALWSSMTGNPYPQSDVERAALAPQVYQYVNNIGRKGGVRDLSSGYEGGSYAGHPGSSKNYQNPAPIKAIEFAGDYEGGSYAGHPGEGVSESVTPSEMGVFNTGYESGSYAGHPGRGNRNVLPPSAPPSGGGSGSGVGMSRAEGLGRKIGEGARAFLGGFKDSFRSRFAPPSDNGVPPEPPEGGGGSGGYGRLPTEQVVEAPRPVTYGRRSRPVDTSRVTWGRGDESIPNAVRGIADPWQERPRGVVVADLSKVQEQGAGNFSYEIPEDIQPGPGLVEQRLDNEYDNISNDYANKAAAYRKSKQYAAMAALHPGLQNIDPNEELIGGVSGATRVLPTQEPIKTTDLYNQRNIPEPIRTGQLVSGADPESPLKGLLGAGEITHPAELVTEQPMRPSASVAVGPSPQEISELDAAFAKALGHLAPEQRAALRDAELDKKYGSQSGVRQLPAEVGSSTPVVVAAVNPVTKANQWRQARARADRSEDARVGRLDSYGYDPYEPVEETNVMQKVPRSRQALLAEQMQRNAMLQAEIPGHIAYAAQKRQAVPSTPYNPQEFRSFIKPASVWMGG